MRKEKVLPGCPHRDQYKPGTCPISNIRCWMLMLRRSIVPCRPMSSVSSIEPWDVHVGIVWQFSRTGWGSTGSTRIDSPPPGINTSSLPFLFFFFFPPPHFSHHSFPLHLLPSQPLHSSHQLVFFALLGLKHLGLLLSAMASPGLFCLHWLPVPELRDRVKARAPTTKCKSCLCLPFTLTLTPPSLLSLL